MLIKLTSIGASPVCFWVPSDVLCLCSDVDTHERCSTFISFIGRSSKSPKGLGPDSLPDPEIPRAPPRFRPSLHLSELGLDAPESHSETGLLADPRSFLRGSILFHVSSSTSLMNQRKDLGVSFTFAAMRNRRPCSRSRSIKMNNL